ncbi:MAG: DUF4136 domain-containing protein [Bacteroidota bacterium]
MKISSFIFGILIAMLCIVTQGTAQKVTADMDKEVDFSKFKTYKFLGWQDDSDKLINELDQRRLRDAFKNELSSRSLTYSDGDADIAISLFVVTENKTSTTAYTDYYGGYGRYRRGPWGWGGGFASTTYQESDYVQGTLVMDVYDESTGSLAWQGVVSGAVSDNPQRREKTIPKTIKKLMKKYPVKPAK